MQTVLITGSNRGLGYEFTRQYLAQDAQVIASCRQTESANQLHLLKKKYGNSLTIIPLDVTQENSIKEALNLVEKNFSHLDLLLNNAGIGFRKSFQELTIDDLSNVFLTNAIAPLIMTRTFLPLLAKGNRPLIANITSQLGSITLQTGDFSGIGSIDYNASKAALNMMSTMLASELKAQGIIVLIQSPGWATTDMGGDQAPNTPEEVVSGMIEIFANATVKDTGKYYEWTGEELPW